MMDKRLANVFFFFLEQLSAGVWVGALLTFGIAVAATLFRQLPSVTLAGSVNAQILQRVHLMEIGAATAMTVAALVFLLQPAERTPLRLAKTALLVVMIALLVYYGVILLDRLEHLRTVEIVDFDQFDSAKRALREEFHRLHTLYTRLATANLGLGVGFLLLSACERKE